MATTTQTCDVIILAGGIAIPEMARLTGTDRRSMFRLAVGGITFAESTYNAVRASKYVGRVAIIGPTELQGLFPLEEGDILLTELKTMSENLFFAYETLNPQNHCLLTPSDNPLLSTSAYDDFLSRSDWNVAFCYPYLSHQSFLNKFPRANNIPVKLKDGVWIGAGCVLVNSRHYNVLKSGIERVINSRKSLIKMVALLGPTFIVRFLLRLVTVKDVEVRASQVLGAAACFVPDADPVFAIDVDDPEDWEYLQRWTGPTAKI